MVVRKLGITYLPCPLDPIHFFALDNVDLASENAFVIENQVVAVPASRRYDQRVALKKCDGFSYLLCFQIIDFPEAIEV